MRVTVIGAKGFVGSSFVRHLSQYHIELIEVTRDNYCQLIGIKSNIVIDAAGNSKKYLAENKPFEEFDLSVTHRLRTLRDFPAGFHLHISSVDVYSDLSSPATTREDSPINLTKTSHYGVHKLLAEQLVRHYASHWLIIRLAGMVGPGLRKNPVYDILHGQPLHIHPSSQYQFMLTDDVARIVWALIEKGREAEIYNLCGDGVISPWEIARLAGLEINLSMPKDGTPQRIVIVNLDKIKEEVNLTHTKDTIARFIQAHTLEEKGNRMGN